jgi:hypothetical protein
VRPSPEERAVAAVDGEGEEEAAGVVVAGVAIVAEAVEAAPVAVPHTVGIATAAVAQAARLRAPALTERPARLALAAQPPVGRQPDVQRLHRDLIQRKARDRAQRNGQPQPNDLLGLRSEVKLQRVSNSEPEHLAQAKGVLSGLAPVQDNGLLPGNALRLVLDSGLPREQDCSLEQDPVVSHREAADLVQKELADLVRKEPAVDLISVPRATADRLAIVIASPEISVRATGTITATDTTTGRAITTTATGAGVTVTGAITIGGVLPRGPA